MPFRDVEARRAYQREWTRARRSGAVSTRLTPRLPPTPEDMATAAKVLALLWGQLRQVRDNGGDVLAVARCCAYVAGVTLKATETASLEARLAALENRILGIGGSNGSQN